MISIDEIRLKLSEKPLFAEFDQAELECLVSLMDVELFESGALVVRQDAPGECMYLVYEGEARVVHHREEHSVDLARLRSGDFFGEVALVDHGLRSADVVAVERCTMLKINQGTLSALAGVYPSGAYKLLLALGRILVERLRQSNRRYVDSLFFHEVAKG